MKRRSNTPRTRRLLRLEARLSKEGFSRIAGVDEAGRGPLAGPVVAGAVILMDRSFAARVDDSKKLSARQREAAFDEIIRKAIVGIGIVDEKTIDAINIYQATCRAMELAIANLSTPPEYILVDGIMKLAFPCPSRSIVGGDALCLSIAAASIIAKVTRDRIMQRLDRSYPRYGFARHKGYPTRSHKEALKRYGPSPIHRRTFRPVLTLISPNLCGQVPPNRKAHDGT